MDIPATATKCPHCGEPQGSGVVGGFFVIAGGVPGIWLADTMDLEGFAYLVPPVVGMLICGYIWTRIMKKVTGDEML